MKLLQGDCMELLPEIPDKSVDLVLCDLPYGTTECKWDHVLPMEKLWKEYRRVLRHNGVACVRTGRHFVGMEKDPHYFQVAKERIESELTPAPTTVACPVAGPNI